MSDTTENAAANVHPAPALAHLLLHCEPHRAEEIGTRAGLRLPEGMLDSATTEGWSALHLAPDEWLLIGAADGASAMTAALADAEGNAPLSLVDISDRFLAWDVSGPRVEDLLAAGCPMDLALASFPVGRCTRTLFGKATVTLWRTGDETFRLEVARSFGPYVEALLARALVERVNPRA